MKTERFQVRCPTKGKKAELILSEHTDEESARQSLRVLAYRYPKAFLFDGQTRQVLA